MGFGKMERKKENMLKAGMKNITKKKYVPCLSGIKFYTCRLEQT